MARVWLVHEYDRDAAVIIEEDDKDVAAMKAFKTGIFGDDKVSFFYGIDDGQVGVWELKKYHYQPISDQPPSSKG